VGQPGDVRRHAQTHHDRPPWLDPYSVVEARDHIRRVLAEASDPTPMQHLLPPDDAAGEGEGPPQSPLRLRSGWASTVIAFLELAKQGEGATAQDGSFAPSLVNWIPAPELAGRDHGGADGRNGSSPG